MHFQRKGIIIFCRHDHPMLVAQWQDGVTRRDLANAFTFEEFNKVRFIIPDQIVGNCFFLIYLSHQSAVGT